MRFALSACALAILLSPTSTHAGDRIVGRADATRAVVWGAHGMVASAVPLASQAGLEVLKAGGNAVDAAIAMNAVLAVTEPVSCGLGGDLFAIVWDPKTKRLHGLNASGRAPLALTADQVPAEPDGTIPLYSPYAWTVPGCADGWFELHDKFGKLPIDEVLAPAIEAASEGFPVTQLVAYYWNAGVRRFGDKPGFADVFLPGGKAPREGELFRNPALASTLHALARDGREQFYQGSIAQAIVAFSEANGGFFSMEDFRRHKSTWDDPITTRYRGYDVWELPPNGQGLAALQMLNILELFDVESMGRDSVDLWHVMIEAKKLAYEDRARYYADPSFAEIPLEDLLSKAYAHSRAVLIDVDRAARRQPAGDLRTSRLDEADTTYLCTADANGMMVSLIQSNYTGFGSGYTVSELGFGIQNRGALFSLDPVHANSLQPGKRPFHTIIPAFVTKNGQPLMAFGVMGGGMQPQGHVQVLMNIIDFGMNLQEAGDAPRFHHDGSSEPTGTRMTDGGEVNLETQVPWEIRRGLQQRGHRVADSVGVFGGYQAIWRDPVTGVYAGATESRKDGCALGY